MNKVVYKINKTKSSSILDSLQLEQLFGEERKPRRFIKFEEVG